MCSKNIFTPYIPKTRNCCEGDINGVCQGEADENEGCYMYRATHYITGDVRWKSSHFMPRSAARLFLKVKSIRVERLQDITEEDARREGIKSYWAEPHRDVAPFIGTAKEIGEDLCSTRREAFQQLWDFLNSKRGYGWDLNPWVWVIEFERINL